MGGGGFAYPSAPLNKPCLAQSEANLSSGEGGYKRLYGVEWEEGEEVRAYKERKRHFCAKVKRFKYIYIRKRDRINRKNARERGKNKADEALLAAARNKPRNERAENEAEKVAEGRVEGAGKAAARGEDWKPDKPQSDVQRLGKRADCRACDSAAEENHQHLH